MRRASADQPAPSTAHAVDTDASHIRFVYPFAFEGETLDGRAAAVQRMTWPGQRQPLPVWRSHPFPSDDLLPHVVDFVNPSGTGPRPSGLWRMEDDALRSPAGLGGGLRHSGADWALETRRAAIPFGFEAVELSLYRHGVGFLVIDAKPLTASVDAWFDFIHYFRFFGEARGSAVTAARTVAADVDAGQRTVPFVPPITGDRSTEGSGKPGALLELIIDSLLRGITVDGESDAWWEDMYVPGMLVPYVTLFIDNAPPALVSEHLYRLRNFFHSQQDVHPAPDDAGDGDGVLQYAADQWFLFSLNGAGFLACNAPHTPFFRANLPQHLGDQYFSLFLLALMQRFALMRLSQRVSREWVSSVDETKKAAAFARIRDALLAFTAQGYFAQTMQQEHHHRCYVRWQSTFNLARLYAEVSAEVREMYTYLDLRQRARSETLAKQQEAQTQRVGRRLQLIGWMFGVPVWLFVALNSAGNIAVVRHFVAGPPEIQAYDPLISVGVFAVGITIALIAYRFVSRRTGARRDGEQTGGG